MSLLDDLISWWSLDNDPDDGMMLDNMNRIVLTPMYINQVTGIQNQAAEFDPMGPASLCAASNGLLQLENRPFTFAFWFKFNSITGSHVFISKTNSSPIESQYRIEYDAFTTAIAFRVGSVSLSNVVLAFNSLAPPLNVWHFVVAWLDDDDGFLHIRMDNSNYEAISLNPQVGGMDVNDVTFCLGSNPDASNRLDGAMDEVAFWGRVLTRAEQDELWNNGFGLDFCAVAECDCKSLVCCDAKLFDYNSSEATDADKPFCQPISARRSGAAAVAVRAILEEPGAAEETAIMEEGGTGAILEE